MPKLPIGDIGPVEVVYNYGQSGAVNLSPFLGTIKVRVEDSSVDVREEFYGKAPVDAVFDGTIVDMEVPLTRSALATLEAALPGVTLVTDALTFKNKVGSAMYENAVQICLKPVRDLVVSTDDKEWTLFYKVHPMRALEIPFDGATQKIFLVKFRVFPSQESGEEGEYFQMGIN